MTMEAEAIEVQGGPVADRALVVQPQGGAVAPAQELSVDEILARLKKIQELQRKAMTEGLDYGVVPGTERKDKDGKDISKPTLLKPGAEKLCTLFWLNPQFQTKKTLLPDGHLFVETYCTIAHRRSGEVWGGASAVCTSKESKYAWRKAARTCPNCGKENIRRSKNPGEGYYCWRKTDGCGATFPVGDQSIESQAEGRIPNEDVPDTWNTVVRICEKRALCAGIRLATGASAIFDEEMPEDDWEDDRLKTAGNGLARPSEPQGGTNPAPPSQSPPAGAGAAKKGPSKSKPADVPKGEAADPAMLAEIAEKYARLEHPDEAARGRFVRVISNQFGLTLTDGGAPDFSSLSAKQATVMLAILTNKLKK